MSSHSTRFQLTAPAELQNANQEKLKKEFRDVNQWNMTHIKEMLAKSGLSEPQIEDLITLYENTSCKLQEKFFKLPSEKLQSLLFSMKRQEGSGHSRGNLRAHHKKEGIGIKTECLG